MEKGRNVIEQAVLISEKSRVVDSVLRSYSRVKDYAEVTGSELGEYSYVAQFSLVNKTMIGKFCSIAQGTYIGLWEHNTAVSTHSFYLYETSGNFVEGYKNYDKDSIVTCIENDVWVGANSVILKGVKVHNGAIVGAGAIVTKDVPAYSIAVGNPARVIKYRFPEKDIEFLLKTEWWNQPRGAIQDMVNKKAFHSLDALKSYFKKE